MYGYQHAALVHGSEFFEGTVLSEARILTLPGTIVAVDVEKQSKTEILLTFLLDSGVYHFSLSVEDVGCSYECLQVFKCKLVPLKSIYFSSLVEQSKVEFFGEMEASST